MINKKIKKIVIPAISVLTLVLSIFFPAFARAYSFPFSAGPYSGSAQLPTSTLQQMTTDSMKQATSDIEERYGLDKDSWRSAKRKTYVPRVEIFFDNTNPKVGEKVTAHATPEFFKNDPQNLYYTWYLIHTKDGTPETATNSVEEGKIEASKIMAKGDYDFQLDVEPGTTGSAAKSLIYKNGSSDPDEDGWPLTDNESEKSYAPLGGADGAGGLDEAHTQKSCSKKGSRDSSLCSFSNTSDPTATSYYSSLASSQSNYWCEKCQTYFSDNGGLPASSSTDSRNLCCYTFDPPSYTDPDTGEEIDYPYSSSENYCSGKTNVAPYTTCFEQYKNNNLSTVTSCVDDQYSECVASETSTNDEIYSEATRCYKRLFSTSNASFREDDGSGLDYPTDCSHKWEDAPGYVSGSGHFPTDEEKYWQTDPTDPDTDGDGFVDEADVIGLGHESFTWTYQSGDRVGVVVEGTSMLPTDEKNAYYKIMWGHLDVCDASKEDLLSGDECGSSSDYGYGFLATRSPNEEFPEEKLKVSLSYTPDNPVADPTSDETIGDADRITVTSSLDSTEYNPANLYYTWYIQKKESDGEWGSPLNINDDFDADSSNGLGVTTFSFSPKKSFLDDFSSDLANIKVTAAVSRSAEASEAEIAAGRTQPKRGLSSVEVTINKKGIKLNLYKVDIKDGKATLGEKVCTEGLYKMLCPAVKGQMLAAKVSGSEYTSSNAEFSWNLNGYSFSKPSDTSTYFDGWDNDTIIFFPITKDSQEIEELNITATPRDALQPVSNSRLITVVEPAAIIETYDSSISWPLTYTVEDDTKKDSYKTVESTDAFQAATDSNAAYRLKFVPDYLLDNDEDKSITWFVNGSDAASVDFYDNNPEMSQVVLDDNDSIINFVTGSDEGIYYDLSVQVQKYWSDDEKTILSKVWGVTPKTLEGSSSATVSTVYMSDAETDVEASLSGKQILAAIGTHLPSYFMYLLRLTLTLLVMFVISAAFYALTQKVKFD